MTYRVRLVPDAEAQIFDQFVYIATVQQTPSNAHAWLDRAQVAVSSLADMPRRCPLAEEDEFRPYEIRKLGLDGFLFLFTVLDDRNEVTVIGTRGSGMRPQQGRLPDSIPEIEATLRGSEQAAKDGDQE